MCLCQVCEARKAKGAMILRFVGGMRRKITPKCGCVVCVDDVGFFFFLLESGGFTDTSF